MRDTLRAYQQHLETELGWPGLATYLDAVAYWESRYNTDAVGDGGLAVGAYQMHPSTVDAGWNVNWRTDPWLSTLLAADLAYDLSRYREGEDWRHIRRGWKYPSWVHADKDNDAGALAVEERFAKALKATGHPASFADQKVNAPFLPPDWHLRFVNARPSL